MNDIIRLRRKFRIGATLLDDPAPDRSPEEAVRLYEASYPHVAHCALEDVGPENGAYVYAVVKPPVQTKGVTGKTSAKDVAEACKAIDDWAQAASTADYDEDLHQSVGEFISHATARPSLVTDPFVVALA